MICLSMNPIFCYIRFNEITSSNLNFNIFKIKILFLILQIKNLYPQTLIHFQFLMNLKFDYLICLISKFIILVEIDNFKSIVIDYSDQINFNLY
jgi:hypothetical protein